MNIDLTVFDRHAARLANHSLTDIALADAAERGSRLNRACGGLRVNHSRQKLDKEAIDALEAAAMETGLQDWLDGFFSGAPVNMTEKRPALHMAWRWPDRDDGPIPRDMLSAALAERKRMAALAADIREGRRAGASGRPIRHVLHLGIGGSDLGPRLVHEALKAYRDPQMTLRFAANVDPAELNDALEGLDPETTLIIVVSKSFSTQETLLNARHARDWLAQHLQSDEDAGKQIAAVTAAPDKARAFGVETDLIFGFQDWVGGRYSLWSPVALSLEIALQEGSLERLRQGAHDIDWAVLNRPPHHKIPLTKALVDLWNLYAQGYPSRCIVPYSRRLRLLPAYLQQLEMESNGKGVTPEGAANGFPRAIVWGAEGSNAQHAFFQQLHQGPHGAPVDFILVNESPEGRPDMQEVLLANGLAQAKALMQGRSLPQAREDLRAAGAEETEIDRLAPHLVCPGGRPSTAIFLPRLEPESLGALLAMYEHKTAIEGFLTGVNSFDQYGVELGKRLAKDILPVLQGKENAGTDPVTASLIYWLNQEY